MAVTLLIHGLWMKSPVMWPLGRRLAGAGYSVRYFDYPSRGNFQQSVADLVQEVESADSQEVHLVGHSMGGLLALAAAQELKSQRGRIVALGSPINGSAASHWLSGLWFGQAMLGGAAEALHSTLPLALPPPTWECGVIAGTLPIGLGIIAKSSLSGPHDGAVTVEETRLHGAAHTTMWTSHTGLLLSKPTSEKTIQFLRTGAF